MPMDRGTPDLVRHCVAAVADQYGGDVDKAFAICVAQLQKSGYLKPGTMELTAAGKKKEKEHEAEPDAKKKLKAYEDFLKAAKETRKAEKEETATESYERDFNLLKNPRNRTGLEDAPHTVARKYETVSKQESSMDFMRRLAGISSRYDDRVVSEAKVKKAAKTVYTLFIDGSERFGFHAADDKDAESKAKDWMLKKLGSYNRVKWEVRPEAPSSMGNIHDDWMESRLAEGLESKVTKVLNAAGYDSHDFYFEDGLHAFDLKTAHAMAKVLTKQRVVKSMSLAPLPDGRVHMMFDNEESRLAEAEMPDYGFTNEDGGKFVLKAVGGKFVVEPVGFNADMDMADLYTYAVRKASSMKDAVKIIQKRVRNAPKYMESRMVEESRLAEAQKSVSVRDLKAGDHILADDHHFVVTRVKGGDVYGVVVKGSKGVNSVKKSDESLIIDGGEFEGDIELLGRDIKIESSLPVASRMQALLAESDD